MNGQKVKLSQCMIVKNEEKNIAKALSWGKGIVCEQIVVDTGSTDNTVNIAKEMGASVYHFPWTDDFSAAKNFALEKATGDWIAFLDADEYFPAEYCPVISSTLEQIGSQPTPHVLLVKLLHLDTNGKPISFSLQSRIFRNQPSIRYSGRIHEQLSFTDGNTLVFMDTQDKLEIIHTGYSTDAYQSTNKADRNIRILEAELEEHPDNYELMAYLADSLAVQNRTKEAADYYRRVILSQKHSAADSYHVKSALNLMQLFLFGNVLYTEDEFKNLYMLLQKIAPNHPDTHYFTAHWMLKNDRTKEALSHLEIMLKKLDEYKTSETVYCIEDLEKIYIWLARYHYEAKNFPQVIQYSVQALKLNRYLDGVLGTVLLLFKDEPGQSENPIATYNFLKKLYDFSNERNQLFVYKCARIAGFYSLEDMLFSSFPQELKQSLIDAKKSYIPVSSRNDYFTIHNKVDAQYDAWMNRMKELTPEMFIEHQKELFSALKKEKEDHTVIENRASALLQNLPQFGWLYANLSDYRSKMVLLSIVKNWSDLDIQSIKEITESHSCYFDLDLIPVGYDEVFVDIGAYIGDTVRDFINTYGNSYKHIYCYETNEDALDALKRNTMYYDNITIREKNVSIDTDLPEAASFIKINLDGDEPEALLGCMDTIKANHPKLAISVHHGYEHIWKIPQMISKIDDSYKFYLRYYGGELIPTEIVLYAL